MNTIIRLENMGITLEVSEAVIADVCSADKFNVTYDAVKLMTRKDRDILRQQAADEMDAWYYDVKQDKALYEAANKCYWLINEVGDDEYREENMDKFKAYEARMNEPDFDWDYYSDWHKDMYGYRPHFKAIPSDDDTRRYMCDTWHRARGL